MCIGAHDIVGFGGKSANAGKSWHLILATEANIWCAVIISKWVTKHLIGNTVMNIKF